MRRKWSKGKIIENILEFKKRNVDLSAGNISRNHIPLFTAACSARYFSSWANALEAAGIDYEAVLGVGKARRRAKLVKWTRGKIIKQMLRYGTKNLLTVYRDRLDLYSAGRREFGSWKQAVEAAGYRLAKGSYKNSYRIFPKQVGEVGEFGVPGEAQKGRR